MDLLQLNAPSEWKVSTVGESYLICNHLREPISATVREGMRGAYPYYGPTQIVDYLDHYRVDGKYALIGEDGDHFLKYATRPMTQLANGKFNVNNHAHLVYGTETSTTEWFYYFFMHVSIFPFLTRQGAGRFKLNKAALEELPILLPPLHEQHKIAEILSTWDEAIDLTEQLIAAKQKRKQALMQQLLTGKVRFPGHETEWEETTFGDIFMFLRTIPLSRSDLTMEKREDAIINIHYGDLHATYSSGILDFAVEERVPKIQDAKRLSSNIDWLIDGDLVIADVSEDYEGVGACIELANISDKKVTGGLHTFVVRDTKGKTSQGFRCYILKHPQVAKRLKEIATGASVYGISKTNLSTVQVFLPSLAEQQKIATIIAACDQELSLLQQKLDALRLQKKGLMQQLLTGKIRVNATPPQPSPNRKGAVTP